MGAFGTVIDAQEMRFPGLFDFGRGPIRDFFLVRRLLLEFPGNFDDSGKTTVQ
jgi:hypothetical protein